jgi:hypothetical protein
MSPLARIGRHHVYVAIEEERRSFPSARNARDKVGPLGLKRHVAMLDSGVLEQATDELDAGSLVARRIRRIEPDERLEQLDISDRDPHVLDSSALHHLPVDSREQRIGERLRGKVVGVHESEWLRPGTARPDGERKFRLLSATALVFFLGYLAATLAGAPRQTSSLVFNVAVLPVPFVAWCTYARAPAALRPMWLLCAWAATLWLTGSLVWYGFFLANGSVVPKPPGWWDIAFAGAQLLLIGAIVAAIRSFALVRLAALDACVIGSAGIALGAAFVGQGLEKDISLTSVIPLNRPLLGIVTLMLVAAAALGSWDGIPRSLLLLGLGEVGLTIGNLLYSYEAFQGNYVNDRWANLGWAAGAELCVLAASAVLLGIDRPFRLPARHRVPGHPLGSRATLLVTLLAIALTLGVATYGLMGDRRNVALIGIATSVAIAIAMVCRARDSLRTAERSSELLDSVLAESERTRDALHHANTRLQRKNAELRTLQLAVAQGFNLIDERTQGRLREIVEEAGDDLAALIEETLDD